MAGKYRQLFPRPTWLRMSLDGPAKLITDWLLRAWNIVGQVEEWHEIGGTDEPAFTNNWANVGGSKETAAFYKDPFGRVHLKGSIDTGTNNTTAFTLPAGYRPAAELIFAGAFSDYTATSYCPVVISSAGALTPKAGSGSGAVLDGISFRAEQ